MLQFLALLYLLAFILGSALTGLLFQALFFWAASFSRFPMKGVVEYITVFLLAAVHGWAWYSLVPDPFVAVMTSVIGFISVLYFRLSIPSGDQVEL
ncbi:MAG TPA: hypothetical protein EYN91_17945 [Candidatus Melainabacteria bacterium]|jgi:hypothetical protein|nr:hypothetical protein [Candidatus Melainabacteria bacterium]